ncbi:uncharacterized protein LOC126836869 [Adelges cooleyi]|uniref:uncharacterized protein LOC126836869 n=1 Tax=Adelges cooleyi TaxID=133065 RepID=UPI00217FC9F6|nr:uncharacterized protein LOC126836869 [Adelges cooleyi]
MYLKMSLLICVLHLFTAAWSVGLTESQINTVVEFFEEFRGGLKKEIPRILFAQYLLDSDYTKFENFFPTDETVIDDKTAADFLILLGGIEKKTDNLLEKSMTTYEVNLFARLFNVQDKKGVPDGLLNQAELVNLFDADLNLDPDFEDKIKKELDNNNSINAPTFLAAILKHKPEGNGLDKTQIDNCLPLYLWYRSKQLELSVQQELYKKLNIVSEGHMNLMEFQHTQSSAKALQEFLVFWSEYNTEDHGNSLFFTTRDVRDFINLFSLYDKDNDGVLSFLEFEPIFLKFFAGQDQVDVMYKYTGDTQFMSIATFLKMHYELIFEHDEKVTTKKKNDMANVKEPKKLHNLLQSIFL